MAPPSAETLQRIASETGLPAATLEKVLRVLWKAQNVRQHIQTR